MSPPHLVFRRQRLVRRLLLRTFRMRYIKIEKTGCWIARTRFVERSLRQHCLYRLEPFVPQQLASIWRQSRARSRAKVSAKARTVATARVQRRSSPVRFIWCTLRGHLSTSRINGHDLSIFLSEWFMPFVTESSFTMKIRLLRSCLRFGRPSVLVGGKVVDGEAGPDWRLLRYVA